MLFSSRVLRCAGPCSWDERYRTKGASLTLHQPRSGQLVPQQAPPQYMNRPSRRWCALQMPCSKQPHLAHAIVDLCSMP